MKLTKKEDAMGYLLHITLFVQAKGMERAKNLLLWLDTTIPAILRGRIPTRIKY